MHVIKEYVYIYTHIYIYLGFQAVLQGKSDKEMWHMNFGGKKITDMSLSGSVEDEAVQVISHKPREKERSHVQDCF